MDRKGKRNNTKQNENTERDFQLSTLIWGRAVKLVRLSDGSGARLKPLRGQPWPSRPEAWLRVSSEEVRVQSAGLPPAAVPRRRHRTSSTCSTSPSCTEPCTRRHVRLGCHHGEFPEQPKRPFFLPSCTEPCTRRPELDR